MFVIMAIIWHQLDINANNALITAKVAQLEGLVIFAMQVTSKVDQLVHLATAQINAPALNQILYLTAILLIIGVNILLEIH